jgi:hypothetical protein
MPVTQRHHVVRNRPPHLVLYSREDLIAREDLAAQLERYVVAHRQQVIAAVRAGGIHTA